MAKYIDIENERFWEIMLDEACIEGQQAERIQNELEKIVVEPKRGEWIMRGGKQYCSNCGKLALMDKDRDDWYYHKKSDWCPSCGADMRKKVEE